MDAITLSTLQLAKGHQLEVTMPWRMILIAALANRLFKAATCCKDPLSYQPASKMGNWEGLKSSAGWTMVQSNSSRSSLSLK